MCVCVRVSKCQRVCGCGRLSAAMIVLMATWTEINWQAQINKYAASVEKRRAAEAEVRVLKEPFLLWQLAISGTQATTHTHTRYTLTYTHTHTSMKTRSSDAWNTLYTSSYSYLCKYLLIEMSNKLIWHIILIPPPPTQTRTNTHPHTHLSIDTKFSCHFAHKWQTILMAKIKQQQEQQEEHQHRIQANFAHANCKLLFSLQSKNKKRVNIFNVCAFILASIQFATTHATETRGKSTLQPQSRLH